MKWIRKSCQVLFVAGCTLAAAQQPFARIDHGIRISIDHPNPQEPDWIQIQAVNESIVRIAAGKTGYSASNHPDLSVVPEAWQEVQWTVTETNDQILFQTPGLRVAYRPSTHAIQFLDHQNQVLLAEAPENGRHLTATDIEGEAYWTLRQDFATTPDEAFYGLGQHQSGWTNYQGTQVELAQNNTEVAVPFLVSSHHYGILWDNYSTTRFLDVRDFQSLTSLKLFDKNGQEGWLTATYLNKRSGENFIQRPESAIDYDFLPDMRDFPREAPMGQSKVVWEGSLASPHSGNHLFQFKYAGYVKLWIDGQLLVDRWRQAWNPATLILKVALEAGQKTPVRIEWDPDGGESYLTMRWLPPNPDPGLYSIASEAGDVLSYYFIAGQTPDAIIHGYRQLTGKAPIMPLWSYGFWQSRERYKTQNELMSTVRTFRAKHIPLDNIVQDWSYWKEAEWGSQEFDASRFPDPEGMIDSLHSLYHAHFMISVWPKFYEGIPAYESFNKRHWLYPRNIAKQTRDWIAQGYTSTFYDAFNAEAREGFWELLQSKLFDKGVDAWWLDATEPDIHSNATMEERKRLISPTAMGPGAVYFNAYPIMNARGIYEGQRRDSPGQRVFILTRSAFAGQQRYAAATWSGDIASRWHDFKDQIPAGINFSLSGIPYWTMDIGGFAVERRNEHAQGEALEEWREMNARWYQFGAFCPLFRSHGQFPFREIYNLAPEDDPTYQAMLRFDRLRYRLLPYLYSVGAMVHFDDYTIMRGLIMDYGYDPKVADIGDQYMFGPGIMVNPVTDYQARERQVYLPEGRPWYDFYLGTMYQGGQSTTIRAPLEEIPLLVPGGSIIPAGPALEYTTERPQDTLYIHVYTGRDADFNLYADDGKSYDYEEGRYSVIPMHYNEDEGTLTLGDKQGTFPGDLTKRYVKVIWITPDTPQGFMQIPKGKAKIYRDKTMVFQRPKS
ncbi:MAG: DUF5110 domain-containing protein [Saprospiraceae bacterium]|nr:DUF5110 domain-containing protein [Saprospiraceae bacterium]